MLANLVNRTGSASDLSNESSMQEAVWIKEQHEIAEQVIVPEDPLFCCHTESALSADARFLALPLLAGSLPTNMDKKCAYYGGVDVSFSDDDADLAVAVYVVLDETTASVVYNASELFRITVPYIPSFLAFREIDPLVRLIRQQVLTHPNLTPRAILVDGNGILHTRRAGLACFLGVRTGIPTIGIGKTLFCEAGLTKKLVSRAVCASIVAAVQYCNQEKQEGGTTCQSEPVLLVDRHVVRPNFDSCIPLEERVDRETLVHELSQVCWGLAVPLGEQVSEHGNDLDSARQSSGILACALIAHGGRVSTRRAHRMGSQNPIYVSVGHQINLQDAVAISASLSLARIPEPVRQADLIGRQLLRQAATSSTNALGLENNGSC
jgi:deoxyinosine 3'endonuclease (endonuclease V)